METIILLYVGLLNLIVALVYFVLLLIRRNTVKAILMLSFFLLCPVLAPLFLSLSWLMSKLFFQKEIDFEDLSFRTDKLDMITSPDYDKEINIVPIEEALIISDNSDRRRVILDVLKEDYEKSITMISNALENEDSETSHYVATVITDVKSHFKLTVQQMKEKVEKDVDHAQAITIILDYIHNFLTKKVLTEIEEMTYIEQYEQFLNELYQKDGQAITSEMYKNVIGLLLSIGRNNDAQLWGERSMEGRPLDLDTFKGILKLYFDTGDKKRFLDTLKKLRESNIEYDSECMDLFHFYNIV